MDLPIELRRRVAEFIPVEYEIHFRVLLLYDRQFRMIVGGKHHTTFRPRLPQKEYVEIFGDLTPALRKAGFWYFTDLELAKGLVQFEPLEAVRLSLFHCR